MNMLTSTRQEADVAKAQRRRVFPVKPRQKREKGITKRGFSFRAADDLAAWIDEMVAAGHEKSELIETAVRVGRDVAKRIGDRWFEIEYRARKKNLEPGEMLAELALMTIAAEEAGTAPKSPKKNGP